jgi:hypothetical protein
MFPNVNHKNKNPHNLLVKTILVPMSCLLVKLNPPKSKRNRKIKWPNWKNKLNLPIKNVKFLFLKPRPKFNKFKLLVKNVRLHFLKLRLKLNKLLLNNLKIISQMMLVLRN